MALSLGDFNQLKQQEDQKRMIGYSCLRSRTRRGSQSPPLNQQISELGLEDGSGLSHLVILTKSSYRRSKKGWLATPTWVVVPIGVLPFVARLVVCCRLPMEHLDLISSKVFWVTFQGEGRPNANGEDFCSSAF